MTAPCDLTATEARRLIGRKALSPVELMQSCLDRIDRVNGKLNAVVTLDAEGALTAARAAEAAVMTGARLGPLHGLPVAAGDLLRAGHGHGGGGAAALRHRRPGTALRPADPRPARRRPQDPAIARALETVLAADPAPARPLPDLTRLEGTR